MLLHLAVRLRLRPRLPSVRFSSSIHDDQQQLHNILVQADDARPRDEPSTQWQTTGFRRKFATGMFIRPHYWSHKHRFQPSNTRTAPALVAPDRELALNQDLLHEFGIDPLWETGNSSLLAGYLTELGKIKPRTQTRLTTKTQRRMAKAIRRAKMMGVIPLFYNPRYMPKV